MGHHLEQAIEYLRKHGVVIGTTERQQIKRLITFYKLDENLKKQDHAKSRTGLAQSIASVLATSTTQLELIESTIYEALVSDHKEPQNHQEDVIHETTTDSSIPIIIPEHKPPKNIKTKQVSPKGRQYIFRFVYACIVLFVVYSYFKIEPIQPKPNKPLEKQILARCSERPDFAPIGSYTVNIDGSPPPKQSFNDAFSFVILSLLAIWALLLILALQYLWARLRNITCYRTAKKVYIPYEPPTPKELLTQAEKIQLIHNITQVPIDFNAQQIDVKKSILKAIKTYDASEPEYHKQKVDRKLTIAVHNPADQNPLVGVFCTELSKLFKQHRIRHSIVKEKYLQSLIKTSCNQIVPEQTIILLGSDRSFSDLHGNISKDLFKRIPFKVNIAFVDLSRSLSIAENFKSLPIDYLYAESLAAWLIKEPIKLHNPSKEVVQQWSSAFAAVNLEILSHIHKYYQYLGFFEWLGGKRLSPEHVLFGFRLMYAPLITQDKSHEKSAYPELQKDVLQWTQSLIEKSKPKDTKTRSYKIFEIHHLSNQIEQRIANNLHIDNELKRLIKLAPNHKIIKKYLGHIDSHLIHDTKIKKRLGSLLKGHRFLTPKPKMKTALCAFVAATLGAAINMGMLQHSSIAPPPPLQAQVQPIQMIQLPPGRFCMGSTRAEFKEAWPKNDQEEVDYKYAKERLHLVDMPSFAISKYETTYAQFKAWQVKNKRESQVDERRPNQPATSVTWFEARAFCQAHGLELPTEYQWEYAARAGLRRKYGVVDNTQRLQQHAVFGLDWDSAPKNVGSKEASAGLHDMIGNAWEWTLSSYKDYDVPDNLLTALQHKADTQVSENTSRSVDRVVRGGSFFDSDQFLRSAGRGGGRPDNWGRVLGFRCVSVSSPVLEQ